MPANLSQQYRNAEKQYRRASTLEEELACLELMLREIPKHKGTDKLQAGLKKKISQTRARMESSSSRKSAPGFRMPRQGAARIVLLGPFNSGKSQLFNSLSDSSAAVADYPHTTTQPQPALVKLQNVKVQLIDTPPIAVGDFDPRTESLVRGADLVLLLLPLWDDEGIDRFVSSVEFVQESRTRLAPSSSIDEADIGVTYTQSMLVWTGSEVEESESRKNVLAELLGDSNCREFLPGLCVSAVTGEGIDELSRAIFERLNLIRIFTKNPTASEPDLDDPIALSKGSTVLDFARSLHEELATNFKQARVWGRGRHDGTIVQADHELEDEDIVEIKTR